MRLFCEFSHDVLLFILLWLCYLQCFGFCYILGKYSREQAAITRCGRHKQQSHGWWWWMRQFSISLCFAMIINKCQGQSLMQVDIYLTQPIFLHGQLYVAVSRVTLRNGLKILLTDKNGYRIDTTTNVEYKEVFRMYEHWTSFHKGCANVIFVKFVGCVYYVWYCIFNYF